MNFKCPNCKSIEVIETPNYHKVVMQKKYNSLDPKCYGYSKGIEIFDNELKFLTLYSKEILCTDCGLVFDILEDDSLEKYEKLKPFFVD